jgi:hypothetical protein
VVFDRFSSRKDLPAWSRDEIRKSVLAVYQASEATGGRQHYRTAFLLHYDLRLLPPDATKAYQDESRDPPRFVVYSIEIGAQGRSGYAAICTRN